MIIYSKHCVVMTKSTASPNGMYRYLTTVVPLRVSRNLSANEIKGKWKLKNEDEDEE